MFERQAGPVDLSDPRNWWRYHWQDEFPWQNLLEDGYEWTAPARAFAPNGDGLHQMCGNTWEWTTDFHPSHAAMNGHAARCTIRASRRSAFRVA